MKPNKISATPKRKSATRTMRPRSDDLERAFDLFSQHISVCNDARDIRIYNTAIIVNCAAYIEHQLNEKLEILKSYYEFVGLPGDVSDIPSLKKKGDIRKKWNRIQSLKSPTYKWFSDFTRLSTVPNKWDEGKTVFSDFTALLNLRNEILHYKCDYLESAEVPTEHIRRIMNELCDEAPFGDKPFHQLMFKNWCAYLLEQKKLPEWCVAKTMNLARAL